MHFFSRVFLPFLLIGYMGTETYLKLQHSSLCTEIGCKLAGELLKFDALYLNYLGLIAIISLLIFGYLSLKNKIFETPFFMVLYSAIVFEATILGYQFIANPEPCVFCLGIFSFLIIIALFSHIKNFIVVLVATTAIFLGLNMLTIPKNKAYMIEEGIYLIESKTCIHCKKVKAYLSQNHIDYTSILATDVNARVFLKFVNINTIPVLIIKEKSTITLLNGDKKIITHFDTKSSVNPTENISQVISTSSTQTSLLNVIPSFLGAGEDEGCAITITQIESCTDDNNSNRTQY